MADSDNTPVVVTDDLDEFSALLFGKAGAKEDSEIETPSATTDASRQGNESDSEGDEPKDEHQDDESEDEPQEDAPADESGEADEEDEEDTPPPPKQRKSARERINELTAARREADRRADAPREGTRRVFVRG
jgi:hypothetical protein